MYMWYHYDIKTGVWCAVSAATVSGHIFLDTINAQRYIRQIAALVSYLSDREREYRFFLQDGATAHIANNSSAALCNMFWD
jgi:hypothetical protein